MSIARYHTRPRSNDMHGRELNRPEHANDGLQRTWPSSERALEHKDGLRTVGTFATILKLCVLKGILEVVQTPWWRNDRNQGLGFDRLYCYETSRLYTLRLTFRSNVCTSQQYNRPRVLDEVAVNFLPQSIIVVLALPDLKHRGSFGRGGNERGDDVRHLGVTCPCRRTSKVKDGCTFVSSRHQSVMCHVAL